MRTLIFLVLFSVPASGYIQSDPDNWCRAGFFTTESSDFSVATVKSVKGGRAYFYNDDDPKCPENTDCRSKAYLVSGNELIISRTRNGYACGWFTPIKGSPTIGWLKISELSISKPRIGQGTRPWLGEWKYADNQITFTDNKLPGFLNVVGDAIWKGLGDNVHIGEIDGRYEPKDGIISYSDGDDQFDCKATLRLLGKFLVVSDNLHCGGANVSFSGVYRRTKRY